MKLLYGIYEKAVGVPASSLSRLRGPWPENVEDPWSTVYRCFGLRLAHFLGQSAQIMHVTRVFFFFSFLLSKKHLQCSAFETTLQCTSWGDHCLPPVNCFILIFVYFICILLLSEVSSQSDMSEMKKPE